MLGREPVELVLLLLELLEGFVDVVVVFELESAAVRVRAEVVIHLREVDVVIFVFVAAEGMLCVLGGYLRDLSLGILAQELADFLAVLDLGLAVEVGEVGGEVEDLGADFVADGDVVGLLEVPSFFFGRGRLCFDARLF